MSNLDNLVKLVAEKAQIGEDAARKAVDTIMGFIKDKVPTDVLNQIDSLVGGLTDAAGDAATKAKNAASEVGDKAEGALDDIQDAAGGLLGKIGDALKRD